MVRPMSNEQRWIRITWTLKLEMWNFQLNGCGIKKYAFSENSKFLITYDWYDPCSIVSSIYKKNFSISSHLSGWWCLWTGRFFLKRYDNIAFWISNFCKQTWDGVATNYANQFVENMPMIFIWQPNTSNNHQSCELIDVFSIKVFAFIYVSSENRHVRYFSFARTWKNSEKTEQKIERKQQISDSKR